MSPIPFHEFISCFRKQFLLQTTEGNRYFSKYNHEQGLPHCRWPAMIFIELAHKYGFRDERIIEEMGVSVKEFRQIVAEHEKIKVSSRPRDIILYRKILTKRQLVLNAVKWYRVLSQVK